MKKSVVYGDRSPEERKRLQAESRTRFAEIYKKTLEVLEVSESDILCGSGFQRCWKEILEFWNIHEKSPNCTLLCVVVLHIAWKKWIISTTSKPLMELLQLVENALLEEGYAYEVWSKQPAFNFAMNLLSMSTNCGRTYCMCKTAHFGRYIYAKAFCQIKLKGRDLKPPVDKKNWEALKLFSEISEAKERVELFEAALAQLIPDAKQWPDEQWADEALILGEIKKKHGIDYTQKSQDFGELMMVFEKKLAGRAYDRDLMMLDQFPVSMARCLWPKDTEENLERFFARICKRASKQEKKSTKDRSAFQKATVMNSWIYKQYEDGTWICSKKIKRCKFDLELGV